MPLDGQKICDNYLKQETLLDKVMFLYNLEMYAQQLESIRDLLRDDKLKEEEKEQLPIKDLKQIRDDLNTIREVDEEIHKNLKKYGNESLENMKELAAVHGMVKTHFETELGKYREQQEMDDSLFKDDNKRKLKLNYLVMHMDGLKAKELTWLTNGMIATTHANLDQGSKELLNETKLSNIDYLKNVTMKQFIADHKFSNDQVAGYQTLGSQLEITDLDKANAYDFFSKAFKYSENAVNNNLEENNKDFDKKLLRFITDTFFSKLAFSNLNFGIEFYKTTLGEDGLKHLAVGHKMNSNAEKQDNLSKEEENGIAPIAERGRIQRIKNCAETAKQVLFSEKPLDMEKKEPFNEIFLPVNKNKKSFDTYIKLHSGMNALKSKESFQNTLAKCLAAEALNAKNAKFDVKLIHLVAKSIEDLPTLHTLSQDEIVSVLAKPSELGNMRKRFFTETLSVNEMQRENYKTSMQKLKDNMKSKEGRSTEYQKFYDAVEAVANLDINSNVEQFVEANSKLLQSVRNYIQGKEKVRTGQGGKDRFDNAMDALSIMYQNVPGLKRTIEGMISGVNSKRNVKEGDAKFVQLGNYGAERAAERKQQIEAAKNKGQEKKTAVDPTKAL